MEMGWLVRQGEQYALTPLGLEMAVEARSEGKKRSHNLGKGDQVLLPDDRWLIT